jgi:hypothetical protein
MQIKIEWLDATNAFRERIVAIRPLTTYWSSTARRRRSAQRRHGPWFPCSGAGTTHDARRDAEWPVAGRSQISIPGRADRFGTFSPTGPSQRKGDVDVPPAARPDVSISQYVEGCGNYKQWKSTTARWRPSP